MPKRSKKAGIAQKPEDGVGKARTKVNVIKDEKMELKVQEVEDFRNHMLANKRSLGTIRQYTNILYRFFHWNKKEPRKIKTEDIERFKAHLAIEKEAAKATIYINIKAIQAFYEFLGMDIAKNVKPPKRSGSIPKYLNEEEVRKLFDAVSVNEFNGKRDLAILSVLAYTGLRVNELTHLDMEDIDFNEKTIRVRSGKGDTGRIW